MVKPTGFRSTVAQGQSGRAAAKNSTSGGVQSAGAAKQSVALPKTRVVAVPKATPKGPGIWPPTRLVCARIGVDAVVVPGVSDQSLQLGPGHDPASAAPGEGNCVIAAHRNAYGWWFRHLDKLHLGDEIVLETLKNRFTYRVLTSHVVESEQTSLLQQPAASAMPLLTLYSCTLPKSTRRLVVVAALEKNPAAP